MYNRSKILAFLSVPALFSFAGCVGDLGDGRDDSAEDVSVTKAAIDVSGCGAPTVGNDAVALASIDYLSPRA